MRKEVRHPVTVSAKARAPRLGRRERYDPKVVAAAFILIAPTIIGLCVLNIYPFFDTIRRSLYKSQGLGPETYIGLKNFEKLFKDMNAELPPLTKFVVGLAQDFGKIFEGTTPIIVFGGLAGLWFLVRFLARRPTGKLVLDKIKLRLPGFGQLIRKTAIGRTTRTLGTLMQSGVPVLQALDIVRDTAGNAVIANAYQRIHDAVKEGDNMTPSMEASGQFPPMVVSMVDVGEETGALPDMLTRIANTYDNEVDDAVNAMTSIIEPLMIVCLAVIVGTVVIAMFQPMTALIGNIGG